MAQEAEETLCKQLTALVARELPDAQTQVSGLQRLTGGASSETWSFDAVMADGSAVPLILRREPPGLTRPGSMSNEAHAFQAAARVGVPEPRIVAYDDDPDVLGSPFIVMERIEGETIARRILRDDPYQKILPRLAAQCGELLARIHSIPAADLPGLADSEPLAQARQRLDQNHPPSPACELGYRWLAAHRPETASPTVVHGDFRNGNFIVGPDGIRAVLDWERVHVGDPMEDLGWLCVKAWRFGSPHPVGGFGPLEDLFESYERAGGGRVDPATVRWWQVLGTLRWALGCMDMAERHLSGTVRSVELATIGRRVCEQEYDLLRLIEDDLT